MTEAKADYSAMLSGTKFDSLEWMEFMLRMSDDCVAFLETALERNRIRRDELKAQIKELKERQKA